MRPRPAAWEGFGLSALHAGGFEVAGDGERVEGAGVHGRNISRRPNVNAASDRVTVFPAFGPGLIASLKLCMAC